MTVGRHFSFSTASFADVVAHDGVGTVAAARALQRPRGSVLAFVDLVVVPSGATIGLHRHGADEEVYVVVSGRAEYFDGVGPAVIAEPGDVLINPPGGVHGLTNPNPDPVRLVVVDFRADPDVR